MVELSSDTKVKKKINWWLEDSEFLSKSNFPDLYYFETVCKYIANMIKNIPIPVLATYDSKNKAIYLSVGSKNKKGFPLDINIAYYDYTTILKRWLYQFYPKYEIEYFEEVELTIEEMTEKVKTDKISLNDALLLRKKIVVQEKGIIEKITMLKDEFILNKNGKRQVRISGSSVYPMSLSMFMSKLKILNKEQEKYDFIFQNSSFIKELEDSHKQEILVNYQGLQLLNFFIINFDDLKQFPLESIDPFNYKWGNFKIKFESQSLKNDCLSFYEKEIEKLKESKHAS